MIENGWITPNGEILECAYCEHESFIRQYLNISNKKLKSGEVYNIAFEKGYTRFSCTFSVHFFEPLQQNSTNFKVLCAIARIKKSEINAEKK